jgi:RNA polymerase sigma factor (sigma-70 family)
MQELDDIALLQEYVNHDSEEAFAALVTRHVNKVYSVALRHTGNRRQAEEISQAVFVILARKSQHLGKRVILSGWLYQTARLTAMTLIRGEIRRARREREAHMQTVLNGNESNSWTQIAPLLDAALAGLNETDRNAVVLRFFDGKSMKEVGVALGANEDAAKKRVNRALERLRNFFAKRGVSSTTAILAGAISANSVQAALVALAKTVTVVAVAKGATVSASSLTLIKGTLKIMAWTKTRTAVAVGVAVLFAAGTTTTLVVWRQHQIQSDPPANLSGSSLQTSFPRASWANAGYASPALALETIYWAQDHGDGKMYLASMTPDLQERLRQQFGSELTRQGISLEAFFSQRSKEHIGPVTGFYIWGQQTVSNQLLLRVWIPGQEKNATFKMRNIGDQWKLSEEVLPNY